jgi:hypothetical protein
MTVDMHPFSPARIETVTVNQICCRNCGASMGTIDHLIDRLDKKPAPITAGPWSCKGCGSSWMIEVYSETDVRSRSYRPEEIDVPCFDLLVLPPQNKPVYFVARSSDYNRKIDGSTKPYQGKAYFYDEHTCPTNWLRCEHIVFDGNHDPHGLFEYVGSADSELARQQWEAEDVDFVRMFPQLAPAVWPPRIK